MVLLPTASLKHSDLFALRSTVTSTSSSASSRFSTPSSGKYCRILLCTLKKRSLPFLVSRPDFADWLDALARDVLASDPLKELSTESRAVDGRAADSRPGTH